MDRRRAEAPEKVTSFRVPAVRASAIWAGVRAWALDTAARPAAMARRRSFMVKRAFVRVETKNEWTGTCLLESVQPLSRCVAERWAGLLWRGLPAAAGR